MKKITVLGALLCLAAGFGHAEEPITIGERLTIQSKVLGEERTILVSTPPTYDLSAQHFPVLYLTDGAAHLTHTRGTVDFLAQNGLMPQVIIVGVTHVDRTRELTPTHVASRTVRGRVIQIPTSGGAQQFLDFFERELIPFIEANYRTVSMRLFTGHSFGGLFALNALFKRPEMFNAVLAVSPSLNWDEDFPVRQAKKFFKKRDELNATLFVAMGDEEEGDPAPTRLDQIENILERSSAEGFQWRVMRMPDENHGSVVLRAHYWGLRSIFYSWRIPVDPETGQLVGGLEEIKAHFEANSKRFGVTIVPDEAVINAVGYQIMGQGDVESAIEVFRYNVEIHPESANVYDSLGEAFENAGQLEEAVTAYSKAVARASEIGDNRLEVFTANRDRARRLARQASGG
jgi:predicted alpha/beta superfamily hydrolase